MLLRTASISSRGWHIAKSGTAMGMVNPEPSLMSTFSLSTRSHLKHWNITPSATSGGARGMPLYSLEYPRFCREKNCTCIPSFQASPAHEGNFSAFHRWGYGPLTNRIICADVSKGPLVCSFHFCVS